MSRQTSVSNTPAVAIPGDVRGGDFAGLNRSADVVMQGGLLVVLGASEESCKLPTASTDITNVLKPYGITRSNVARDPNFPAGGTAGYTYQVGDVVEIVTRGRVYVTVEEAVSAGDDVYVRYDTGTGSQKGAFRSSADSSTAALLAGARYLTSAASGGIALVDLNLPQ